MDPTPRRTRLVLVMGDSNSMMLLWYSLCMTMTYETSSG
uniref:Uncharacterized protein n=1 Tax=Arundo donax TaxID=35708 RepID=A0A0A9DT28_ARUDO